LAIVTKPWSGAASRFTDEEYRRSCLICEPNCTTPKSCCHLPVKEPNGDINKNALSSALGAINGARSPMKISASLKKSALSKLRGYYKQAGMDMKAANSYIADGKIWDVGKHDVFVNGEPKRLWVGPETIVDTYRKLQARINEEGVNLGIDHLPEEVVERHKILKKMDLLNVGEAKMVGTNGKSIYLLDSEVTNQEIEKLGLQGELPSYSVVGPIKADECTSRDDIDLVLKSLDIHRIDFVEAGGCRTCKVGEKGEDMMVFAKLSTDEGDIMTEKEEVKAEEVEQTEAVEQTETEEESTQEEVIQADESRMDRLENAVLKLTEQIEKIGTDEIAAELATVKGDLEEQKLEARRAVAKESVEGYIKAGIAVPAQREALEEIAVADPDGFDKLMASSPKILKFSQTSQHVEAEESESEEVEVDPLTDYPKLTEEQLEEMLKE